MTRYGAAAARLGPAIERLSPEALAPGARRSARKPSSAPAAASFPRVSSRRRCCAPGSASRRARGRAHAAPPLHRLGRRRAPAFLLARRRRGGRGERGRAGARRRLVASARRRRRMGRDSARGRNRGRAIAARQLRLRSRLVARLCPPLRRPAAEDDRARPWREKRARRGHDRRHGIEGGAVYALSRPLRDAIEAQGSAILTVDLKPDLTHAALAERLRRRPGQSLSTYLARPPVCRRPRSG